MYSFIDLIFFITDTEGKTNQKEVQHTVRNHASV